MPAPPAGERDQADFIAAQITCPITLDLLQDPRMCPHCSANFERAAIEQALQRQPRCPACRHALQQAGLLRNRALENVLPGLRDMSTPGRAAAQNRGDGMTFVFSEPYKIILAGCFGAGKSTLTNILVDPSGELPPVAAEGGGAQGVTQDVTRVFPRPGGDGQLPYNGRQISLQLWDTPGFCDPDRHDSRTLQQFSAATLQVALGMDAVVHVVKMGRMTDGDRCLPELLLSGLTATPQQRQELARRWVIVVTHCDSQRRAVMPEQLEQFRGAMAQFFPVDLRGAVDRAVFVENDARRGGEHANADANRTRILQRVVSNRQVYHRSFASTPLDEISKAALTAVLDKRPGLKAAAARMTGKQVSALLQFFETVVEDKKYVPITTAVRVSPEFSRVWSELSVAVRDRTAVQVAKEVLQELRTQCDKTFEREATAKGWRKQASKWCPVQ